MSFTVKSRKSVSGAAVAESSLDMPRRPQARQHAASEPTKSSFNPFTRPGGGSKFFLPGSPLRGLSISHPIEIAEDYDEPDYTPTRPGPRRRTAQPRPVRPANEGRVQSDPFPRSQDARQERGPPAKDPREVDNNIRHELNVCRPLKKEKNESWKKGLVYMIPFYHGNKRVLKIGFTSKIRQVDRAKEIERGCNGLDWDRDGERHCTERILHFMHLEKLVHAELRPWRYDFVCACGKQHTEFFDVDEALARRVIDHWEKLCAKPPWTSTGPLTSFWKLRLDSLPSFPLSETFEDHEARHEHWETFINADAPHHIWHDIKNFLMLIWDWRLWLLIWGQGAYIYSDIYSKGHPWLAAIYGLGVLVLGIAWKEAWSATFSYMWSEWRRKKKVVPNSPRSPAKGSTARDEAGSNLPQGVTPSPVGSWVEDRESEPESSDEGDERE